MFDLDHVTRAARALLAHDCGTDVPGDEEWTYEISLDERNRYMREAWRHLVVLDALGALDHRLPREKGA